MTSSIDRTAVNETPDLDRLVRDHMGLVNRVVARVAAGFPRHVERDELANAGMLGLVEAAKRYDHKTGVPFDRYAAIRVRGAILDSTRSRDWVSRSVRRQSRELAEAEETLSGAKGKSADQDDVASYLGVSVSEVARRKARAAESMLLSLDYEAPDTTSPQEQLVEERREAVPEDSLLQRETVGTLLEAVASLPGKHGDVVRRYYFEGHLLQEIAADLGVTEARVSQINSEAVSALRRYFGSLYDGVPEVDESSPGKRTRAAFIASLTRTSTWKSRLEAADTASLETEMAMAIA